MYLHIDRVPDITMAVRAGHRSGLVVVSIIRDGIPDLDLFMDHDQATQLMCGLTELMPAIINPQENDLCPHGNNLDSGACGECAASLER